MNALISSWLISIVGIVILGVLIDLVLPDGQMQKYIKAIFSVVVVLVMVSPVLNVDLDKIDFDKFIYNQTSIELNDRYLENYKNSYNQTLEEHLKNALKEGGFSGVEVSISCNLSNKDYEIEKVTLNIKKMVINANQAHIDKYKEMRQIVLKILNIKESKIEFYE